MGDGAEEGAKWKENVLVPEAGGAGPPERPQGVMVGEEVCRAGQSRGLQGPEQLSGVT